ncbi:molybdopterin-guanine dinucleotide biosynthesis protein B, partial [Yersinia pestis]
MGTKEKRPMMNYKSPPLLGIA